MSVNAAITVVHVVAPSFGHSFSGQTYPIIRLLNRWERPNINLNIIGSSFEFTGDDEFPQDKLWDNSIRNNKIRRFKWTIQLIFYHIVKRNQYDIIHLHVLWWGGLITPLLAHVFDKKAVYLMSLEGSDNPSAVASEQLGTLKMKLFKQFDGVIGLSSNMIEDCRNHNFSSELLVLPNFMALDEISNKNFDNRASRKRWRIPNDAQVVLFVGSIIKRKGVNLVIDTFLNLHEEWPNLWLVLVGAKEQSENPRVDERFVAEQGAKVENIGKDDRVVWTGLIRDGQDLACLYKMSDIFLFPSRAEGLGNVILEAMAARLPVVCSKLYGITDTIVVDNETGFLVDTDDRDGFSRATECLLENEHLRNDMGACGEKRIKEQFGFDAYCKKLESFYWQVFKGR